MANSKQKSISGPDGLKRRPKAAAPLNVDNRIHVVRRMRALGSTTEQIAAVMMIPVTTVLAIEKS